MATMNISLPDQMRDYVQDRIDSGKYASASDYVRALIRRDRGGIEDEQRWLRELDASIADGIIEMEAGGGVELDVACNDILAELDTMVSDRRP